jgi:cell division protein FtsX
VLPGLSAGDRKQDPAAYRAAQDRVVEVFLKDGLSAADKLAMARRIAAMPEVEAYHFVSKAEALRRFGERFGKRIVANLPINPLPASFEILVREQTDVVTVAQRFYHDPMVDNAPGLHDGVQARGGSSLPKASPSP